MTDALTVHLDTFTRLLTWMDTMCAGRQEADPNYAFTQGMVKHVAGGFDVWRMRLAAGQHGKAEDEAVKIDRWLVSLSDELHQLRRDPVLAETADMLCRDFEAIRAEVAHVREVT